MNKNNIKTIIIIILLLIVTGLVVYGVNYAIKNKNRDEITTLNDVQDKYTINKDQLDNVKLPVNDNPLVYNDLPEINNTIEDIDYKTFEKIFKSHGKSILILTKNDCSYCEDYLPIAEKSLNDNNIKAYKINVSNLSKKEKENIYQYIDYDGEPTTYYIVDGNAKHSLTGIVDKETLDAFIDYFYIRNN